MIQGTVFDIQKFCVHDGPGIRTTVFLKGCPLRCLWCHNPESWNAKPEILFASGKCAGCGACAKVCFYDALELCGKSGSAEEVFAEVAKDKAFYENSGGGMTVSGGEPMAQFAFTKELLTLAKADGIFPDSAFGSTAENSFLPADLAPPLEKRRKRGKVRNRKIKKRGSSREFVGKSVRDTSEPAVSQAAIRHNRSPAGRFYSVCRLTAART